MREELFRKVALERLSSPEQMDQLIHVTSPRGWLALFALLLLLATAVGWGVVGRVPTQVLGEGILIKPGGVQKVVARTSGQVTRLSAAVGEVVERGAVVATIFLSDERAESQLDYITSPHSGRILEVMVSEGNAVSPGTPIANIESLEQELEAVIYVPLADGKKVRPGMVVQISPSTVRREEYGLMLGTVRSVAEYPSTPQGMMRLLENANLVERLSGDGTPIEVLADLTRDPTTQTGYKWTSSRGPPITIQRGTVCTATITVKEQRPITLVIPAFKEILGL